MMELPEFNIMRDDETQGVRIWFTHQYDLEPILPAILYEMREQFWGEAMTPFMLDTMRMKLVAMLEVMCEQGYIFKLANNRWRVNVIEYVANRLSHSIRHGRIVESYTWSGPTEKGMLAECLVNSDGELREHIRRQPAEIIEWFAKEINHPILDEAVEKFENEMVVDIANIK